jgi:hypothetical protein
MRTKKRTVSLSRVWLSLLVLAGIAAPVVVSAQTITREPWQIHQGNERADTGYIQLSDGPVNMWLRPQGNPVRFAAKEIPDEGERGDKGWTYLPGDTITIKAASRIAKCYEQVDFTYFQTFVTGPAGVMLEEFKVRFDKVDDAARAYVFNTRYPSGQFVEGADISLFSKVPVTGDLRSLIQPGERNRIVIVQFDDCPTENNIVNAQLIYGGTQVPTADPPPPPQPACQASLDECEALLQAVRELICQPEP